MIQLSKVFVGLAVVSVLGCAHYGDARKPVSEKADLVNSIYVGSPDVLQKLLGEQYLVPDVFKDQVGVGTIIDVGARDFTRIFSAEHCFKDQMDPSGKLPHQESGGATVPAIEILQERKFDLMSSGLVDKILPNLALGTSVYQHLVGQVRRASFASVPVGELRLSEGCMMDLDERYRHRLKGDQFQGIVLVGEAIYSESAVISFKDVRTSSFTMDWLLSKALSVNPELRARKIDNESLEIEERRLIAVAPGDLFYHEARPGEGGVVPAPQQGSGQSQRSGDGTSRDVPRERNHRISARHELPRTEKEPPENPLKGLSGNGTRTSQPSSSPSRKSGTIWERLLESFKLRRGNDKDPRL